MTGFEYDVFYARSTNNGATWTPAAALNTNATTDEGDDTRAQIITDSAGTWLAVWTSDQGIGGGGFDNDIVYVRSTDGGVTWTAPAVVNTNAATDAGFDYRPGVATDNAGNWVIVWHSNSNIGGSGNDFDVFHARSTNNGATWTAPALLNSTGTIDAGTDEYARVSTDGLGNWIAVWNSNSDVLGTGPDYDIFYCISTNNGASWTTTAALNTTATTDFWFDLVPQVTPDGQGNWISAWESNGDIDGNTASDFDVVFSRFTLAGLGLGVTSIVPATTGPTNATSVGFTVGFSESVVNFNNAADLVINHTGTANTGVSISGGPQSYTVNVTGLSGNGVFTLAVSTASDVQSPGGTPLVISVTSPAVSLDNAAPGITLASAAGDPVTGAIAVTATLTEPSANFTAGDITAANAAVSNFAGSGSAYTFTLTPTATGLFSAAVGAGLFTDAAGNANTASNEVSRTADLTGPSITLSTAAGDPVTGAITVNAALTQPSTNFAAADVVTVNAIVNGFSGSGASYSFTLTPLANGVFSATVPAGTFTNAGGNANTASNTIARTANLAGPPPGSNPSPAVVVHPNQNNDFGDDERPMLATDNQGNWVMVWDVNVALNGAAGNDLDILVTRSSNNGADWSAPALLNTNGMTDGGQDIRPMVTTNGAGMWIAVWNSNENLNGTAGADNDIFYTRSTDNGATWSAPALLNTNGTVDGGSDEMPRIAADGAGNWVATWLSNSNIAANGTEYDVFVARSSDNGATWSAPAVLNSNGMVDFAFETRADVVTDGAGTWIALWASDENLDGQSAFDNDVFMARSTDNGATWAAPALLNSHGTTDGALDWVPVIGTDRAGTWVGAWETTHTFGGTAGSDFDIAVTRFTVPVQLRALSVVPATTGPTNAAMVNFTVTFNSDAVNFNNAADLLITHTGTVNSGATITGGPRSYAVGVTGITGTGSFTLAVSTASDVQSAAGGTPLVSSVTSAPVVIDNTAPSVVLASAAAAVVNGAITVTATLSEASANFTAGDITAANAAVSNFAGGGTNYSFVLTPAASGAFSATVAAGTFTDGGGSGNVVSNTLTRTADLTPPTATLTSTAAALVRAPILVNVVLSEASADFTVDDLTLVNAAASAFTGSGITYSFTLTPLADGVFSAAIAAGTFTDAVGNGNAASAALARTADLTPPVITLTSTAPDPVNTFITVTATLSEPAVGFSSGDVTLANCTISNFSGTGTAYTFRLTPTTSGLFGGAVAGGAFTDAAGNPSTLSNVIARTADLVRPTATLSTTAVSPVKGPIAVTMVTSEPTQNLVAADLTLVNATVTNFAGSGTAYSFTLTPISGGTFSARLLSGVFTDAAGNTNTSSATLSRTADLTPPTVSLTSSAASVVRAPITVTITASQATTNFVAGDLVTQNANVTAFAQTGTRTYSITLAPIAQGLFSVQVPAGAFTDAAGNGNVASGVLSRTADFTAPTATLSTTAGNPVTGAIVVTVVLSEPSTSFTSSDVTRTNSSLSNFTGSGTNYSFTLTPTAAGVFTASVPASRFTDAAGNQNVASNVLSRTRS